MNFPGNWPAILTYVIEGLCHGFKLGFQASHRLRPAKKNKPSALQYQKVVDEYLANEVALGRVAGPFISPQLPHLHISSFGVIPKRGQPGKWRLIIDLSSPGGSSVNDGIDPQDLPSSTSPSIGLFRWLPSTAQGL